MVAESIERLIASMRGNQTSCIRSVLPLLAGRALALGRVHKLSTDGKAHRVVVNDKSRLSG
eukprot:2618131-Amphidinium_carterae.1